MPGTFCLPILTDSAVSGMLVYSFSACWYNWFAGAELMWRDLCPLFLTEKLIQCLQGHTYSPCKSELVVILFSLIFPSPHPFKHSDQQLLTLHLTPKSCGLSITLLLAQHKLAFTVDCRPFLFSYTWLLLMKGLNEGSWHWLVSIAVWKEMYPASEWMPLFSQRASLFIFSYTWKVWHRHSKAAIDGTLKFSWAHDV